VHLQRAAVGDARTSHLDLRHTANAGRRSARAALHEPAAQKSPPATEAAGAHRQLPFRGRGVRNDVILHGDLRLCGEGICGYSREPVEEPSLTEKNHLSQQFPVTDISLPNSIRSAIDNCSSIFSDIHIIEVDRFPP
jgi:hypothetical protein